MENMRFDPEEIGGRSEARDIARRGLTPVEGRVLRPGERAPGIDKPYVAPPKPKPPQELMQYFGPVNGRIMGVDVFSAFVMDGTAAGTWKVERNHWRAVEMDASPIYMSRGLGGTPYLDESVHTKTTTYSLHKLGLMGPGSRRMYGFWSSLPPGQIEPIDALFLLIDAEPWQSKACRLE
jgi:hypothetical protein